MIIFLYILLSIVVFSVVMAIVFALLYRMRFYLLFQQTGAYTELNKYITSDKSVLESSYIGGKVKKRDVQIGQVTYDNLFFPKNISLILSLEKKDNSYGFFKFLLVSKDSFLWEVNFVEELDMEGLFSFNEE